MFHFMCVFHYVVLASFIIKGSSAQSSGNLTRPFVIATWPMEPAVSKAWLILSENGSSLDAIEGGINECEMGLCGPNVGFGGKPNENGETTLDAMIMDGETHNAGAVGNLRRIKLAISVARIVMEHTKHTFLVGDEATNFAVQMGFTEENLTTPSSVLTYQNWTDHNCQPNHRISVVPNPLASCGPYKLNDSDIQNVDQTIDESNHDTISMIAIDDQERTSVGASTNGLRHKIPGRVGDSPIPGSGAYVDKAVGAATATGNGDVMMRFVPSFMTVEHMRAGLSPSNAAAASLRRISAYYPSFSGAIIAVNNGNEYGVACYNLKKDFRYTVGSVGAGPAVVLSVKCLERMSA